MKNKIKLCFLYFQTKRVLNHLRTEKQRKPTDLSFWDDFARGKGLLKEKQNHSAPNKNKVQFNMLSPSVNSNIKRKFNIMFVMKPQVMKLRTTYPNFNMKINWTIWTTFRISYDSKIPRALRTFVMTSKTMYLVNLKWRKTNHILVLEISKINGTVKTICVGFLYIFALCLVFI